MYARLTSDKQADKFFKVFQDRLEEAQNEIRMNAATLSSNIAAAASAQPVVAAVPAVSATQPTTGAQAASTAGGHGGDRPDERTGGTADEALQRRTPRLGANAHAVFFYEYTDFGYGYQVLTLTHTSTVPKYT